ncbi:LysR family transcriptional regulator [Bordetella sp. FB-8]|uniref:LysR family transcriptional regulator n=1 Tax=Bordetella sp. FB-8 TaxID=1159870 RepID=UPI0009D9D585
MKRLLPWLNALRAFEAAGRHGSFKDAAAALRVTNNVVSPHARRLEAWQGAPLLLRHNRSVLLPPAARACAQDRRRRAAAALRRGHPAAHNRINSPSTTHRRNREGIPEHARTRHCGRIQCL